eukprot:5349294-Prymnesium_polylepis.2
MRRNRTYGRVVENERRIRTQPKLRFKDRIQLHSCNRVDARVHQRCVLGQCSGRAHDTAQAITDEVCHELASLCFGLLQYGKNGSGQAAHHTRLLSNSGRSRSRKAWRA